MFSDIITVAQKELKEILLQRGSMRGGLMNLLIVLAIIGILFPLDSGPEWLSSPTSLITMIWLPLLMSMGLITDSFAGERERHTLETLLATRLSDQAILFGKITASMTYAMGLAIVGGLLGAVTVNVQYPGAGFYSPSLLAGMLIFGVLGSLLVSAMGVLVSLHAENVRQAYQRMSIGYLALVLPLAFAPRFLPRDIQLQIAQWLNGLDLMQAAAAAAGGLALVNAALLVLCMARFQRARLIAD